MPKDDHTIDHYTRRLRNELHFLKDAPTEPLTLAFLDAHGDEITSFTSAEPPKTAATTTTLHGGNGHTKPKVPPKAPAEAGMNRFVWNTRYRDATVTTAYSLSGEGKGNLRLRWGC